MADGDFQGFLDGVKKKFDDAKNSDWANKARDEAGKVIKGANIGGVDVEGVQRKAQNGDWTGVAGDAAKVLGNGGVANVVGGAMFPQGAIVKFGAEQIGGVVANRQARALLEDKAALGDKLASSFDSIDGNKNGFIKGDELKEKASGIGSLFDGNRGVVPILDKAYTKFASFDGKDEKEGISKADIDLFKTVQGQKAIDDAVSDAKWSGAKWGGIVGGTIGLGLGLLGTKGKLAGRVFIAAGGAALAGGLGTSLWEGHSSESYYAGKKKEADDLVDWLKREL